VDEFRKYLDYLWSRVRALQRTVPPLEEALRPKYEPRVETRVIKETIVQPAPPPTVVERRTLVGILPLAIAVVAALAFLLLWLLTLTRASGPVMVYAPTVPAPTLSTERPPPTESSIVSAVSAVSAIPATRAPLPTRPTATATPRPSRAPTAIPTRSSPTPTPQAMGSTSSCSRERVPLYSLAENNVAASAKVKEAIGNLGTYSDRFKLIQNLGQGDFVLRDVRVYSTQATVDQVLDYYRAVGAKGECMIERDLGIERLLAIRDVANTFSIVIVPFEARDLSALGIGFDGFIMAIAERKVVAQPR